MSTAATAYNRLMWITGRDRAAAMDVRLLFIGPNDPRQGVPLVLSCRPYQDRLRNAYREYRRIGLPAMLALDGARAVAGGSC